MSIVATNEAETWTSAPSASTFSRSLLIRWLVSCVGPGLRAVVVKAPSQVGGLADVNLARCSLPDGDPVQTRGLADVGEGQTAVGYLDRPDLLPSHAQVAVDAIERRRGKVIQGSAPAFFRGRQACIALVTVGI